MTLSEELNKEETAISDHYYEVEDIPRIFEVDALERYYLDNGFRWENHSENYVKLAKHVMRGFFHVRPMNCQLEWV